MRKLHFNFQKKPTTFLNTNMSSFATLETQPGFPMPDFPRETDGHYGGRCKESDVNSLVKYIINKEDWTSKIDDDEAINEWAKKLWGDEEQPDVLRYAVDECRWRRDQWQGAVGTPAAFCKAGLVLKRDGINQALRSSIMLDLDVLRRDQEKSMSTMAVHPKYKKIVQLVHPSLYCYQKGMTHVLPNVGADVVAAPAWNKFLGYQGVANSDAPVKPDTKGLRNNVRSYRRRLGEEEPPTAAECSLYQWLPSEFFVSTSPSVEEPTKCKINSYINNLHPIKYAGLYDKIGELFVEVLPMMEEVLAEVNDGGKVRKMRPRFKSITRPVWRPYLGEPKPKVKELPIPSFSRPSYTGAKKPVTLHDRPLQVIVKLISMELKPDTAPEPDFKAMDIDERHAYWNRECPNYFETGHWHVEGTLDERIVASACCYLTPKM